MQKRRMSFILAAALLVAMAPGVATAAPEDCPSGGGWGGLNAANIGPHDVGNTDHTDGFVCAKVNRGLSKKFGEDVHVITNQLPPPF